MVRPALLSRTTAANLAKVLRGRFASIDTEIPTLASSAALIRCDKRTTLAVNTAQSQSPEAVLGDFVERLIRQGYEEGP